jgi:ADP-ribose pyrophosphatase YjhB (NUDIX family)
MIENISIDHHIQKYIINVLMFHETARFRDLRPPRTDTNLFSYHLKLLLKSGVINKVESGYALSGSGLSYVDRVSTEQKTVRTQPKIITMLLVQNSNGDVLLQKRDKQPYINAWTLPYGKLHIEDETLAVAARREAKEKLGLDDQSVTHIGDAYIRVKSDGAMLSTTLAHVFRFNCDEIQSSDSLAWVRPHKLSNLRLAPAVEAIMTRGFFNDPFFFEEFEESWTA